MQGDVRVIIWMRRNFAAWPWSLKELRSRLKKMDLDHYYQAS